MPIDTRPQITWEAAFANQLDFGYPLDNAVSYSQDREGSEWVQGPSGVEESWLLGVDDYLAADVRWIPTADTTNPVATGWDGATGWRAFLAWARDMANPFRFFPDKDLGGFTLSTLVTPREGEPGLESDGTRRFRFVIRNSAGNPYTGY